MVEQVMHCLQVEAFLNFGKRTHDEVKSSRQNGYNDQKVVESSLKITTKKLYFSLSKYFNFSFSYYKLMLQTDNIFNKLYRNKTTKVIMALLYII